MKKRLDVLLVERGLAASRSQAQALVLAGLVPGFTKPGAEADEAAALEVAARPRFVSRGGEKLDHALDALALDIAGLDCLDVGASTGGFTDCLLQHGARRVVAVDVGRNQLDWRLRTAPRVEVREQVNARHLTPEDFKEQFDLAVMDVSFISATKILPALVPLLKAGGRLVLLIKPQFEVGRGEVGKGGLVTDPRQHARVVEEVNSAARALGLTVRGVTDSPITGADGNREFLALYEKAGGAP